MRLNAVLAVAVVVLVLGTALFFLSSQPQPSPKPSPSKPVPSALPPVPGTSGLPSSSAFPSAGSPGPYAYVFFSLNSAKAEKICVDLAREFAGDKAWAVFGCSCSEAAAGSRKDYACSISTIEGGKPATAACVKAEERCLMSAEGYQRYITFQEIAQKYG